VDDIEAIKQLTARYNLAFDDIDVDGWLATWTDDGFFERSNAGRSYQGHSELTQLISEFPVKGRHVTTNFIIEVDGDAATMSCYLTYLDPAQNFAVVMFGVYADEVIRTPTGWRFSSRRLQVDEVTSA
jgi:3-phenylpropionate/cinnamic acid dioxygenase small subunit